MSILRRRRLLAACGQAGYGGGGGGGGGITFTARYFTDTSGGLDWSASTPAPALWTDTVVGTLAQSFSIGDTSSNIAGVWLKFSVACKPANIKAFGPTNAEMCASGIPGSFTGYYSATGAIASIVAGTNQVFVSTVAGVSGASITLTPLSGAPTSEYWLLLVDLMALGEPYGSVAISEIQVNF